MSFFTIEERYRVPIEQVAIPSDIAIFGTHWGSDSYYADFAGIARKHTPRSILEIGVRFGYSAIALCLGALAGGAERVRYVGLDAEILATGPHGESSNEFAAVNLARMCPDVKAKFYTCDTLKGLPPFLYRMRFDLVNVDGDHSYEGCLGDMKRTWGLLNPGGIMIVDDTGMADVKRAIEECKATWEATGELDGFQFYPNERGFGLLRRVG